MRLYSSSSLSSLPAVPLPAFRSSISLPQIDVDQRRMSAMVCAHIVIERRILEELARRALALLQIGQQRSRCA